MPCETCTRNCGAKRWASARQHDGGAHQEHRQVEPSRLLLHQDVGERLHRLAQPHVVGQDAVQVEGAQELQPGQAVHLVGAQGGAEILRRLDAVDALEVGQAMAELAQRLVAAPAQVGLRFQLRKPCCVHA